MTMRDDERSKASAQHREGAVVDTGQSDLQGALLAKDHAAEASHEPSLGGELHPAVYICILASYFWFMLVAWLAFAGPQGVDLDLGIATVLFLVLFGATTFAFVLARHHWHGARQRWEAFWDQRIPIATGPMRASEVVAQVLLIPGMLALMATAFAIIYVMES